MLVIASVSFIGIGMMTSVMPLISPEKGMQLGFIAQGMLLVVSGVYYPVSVLPEWMQSAVEGSRPPRTRSRASALRSSTDERPGHLCGAWIWPLLIIGAISIPLGLWIFHRGESVREEAREAEAQWLSRSSTSRDLRKTFHVHERESGIKSATKPRPSQDGEVKAVDGVSFTSSAASASASSGPNGAGKTTTLKVLSGLLYDQRRGEVPVTSRSSASATSCAASRS